MAEWKKVIVSGSNAELNQVTASFFSGDGSALTNVPAGSVNIESFTDGTGITVATTDKLLVSDAGTEKYINVSQLPFNNFSLGNATSEELGGVIVGSGLSVSEGTISVSNIFTNADETKLDGIETSADVTDATNVAAAGAIMDGDFTSNGFMKRTGAGTYTVDTSTYATSATVTALDGEVTSLMAATSSYAASSTVTALDGEVTSLMAATSSYLTTLGSVTGHSDVSSAGSGQIITSAERTKLSGIATNANNYTLPNADGETLGGVIVGTGLSVSEGTISVTQTTANDFTTALKNKLDGIEASADVTDTTNVKSALNASVGSMTIGDSNDTVTIGNDLVVTGDLTVNGDTTTVSTTNLNVTDKFINLNDGGSAADGGIVIEGQGTAFGWDESENRWAFDFSGATETQTTIASDAYAVAVVTTDDANYRKTGNMRVQSGEIYIYV